MTVHGHISTFINIIYLWSITKVKVDNRLSIIIIIGMIYNPLMCLDLELSMRVANHKKPSKSI